MEDIRKVNFGGLDYGDRQKLKDHHVMDVLTNHVKNADLVIFIDLNSCSGITNDTLIQISNMRLWNQSKVKNQTNPMKMTQKYLLLLILLMRMRLIQFQSQSQNS